MLNSLTGRIPLIRASRRDSLLLAGLTVGLLVVVMLSAGIGAVSISPGQFIAIIAERVGLSLPWAFDARQEHVLLAIRLPRVLLGAVVGGGLAVSGCLMQGLFRNPLADPSLVGTSGGASLGAVAMIVLGSSLLDAIPELLGAAAVPAAAFVGGFAATSLVYRIATLSRPVSAASMLLMGIAVNALAGAAVGLFVYLADDAQLRSITFWSMGSLAPATWGWLSVTAPLIAVTVVGATLLARRLNALSLGEAEARHLGIGVDKLIRMTIILSSLAVGASVAVTGVIGFVGLIAPHIIRQIVGPDHRTVIPCSILLGAAMMPAADLVARTVVIPAELPIGIITALIGSPVFIWLLIRTRSAEGGALC